MLALSGPPVAIIQHRREIQRRETGSSRHEGAYVGVRYGAHSETVIAARRAW